MLFCDARKSLSLLLHHIVVRCFKIILLFVPSWDNWLKRGGCRMEGVGSREGGREDGRQEGSEGGREGEREDKSE